MGNYKYTQVIVHAFQQRRVLPNLKLVSAVTIPNSALEKRFSSIQKTLVENGINKSYLNDYFQITEICVLWCCVAAADMG
jgi:hypothetical protein